MALKARFLGFERETVRELVIEKALFSFKFPTPKWLGKYAWTEAVDPLAEIEIDYQEFELERVLSIDDGGPLAIYGRVR